MECLCGHHIAIDCPAHGASVNRMRVEDMLVDADEMEEYLQWSASTELGGEA